VGEWYLCLRTLERVRMPEPRAPAEYETEVEYVVSRFGIVALWWDVLHLGPAPMDKNGQPIWHKLNHADFIGKKPKEIQAWFRSLIAQDAHLETEGAVNALLDRVFGDRAGDA
jgi:hypothetical protein